MGRMFVVFKIELEAPPGNGWQGTPTLEAYVDHAGGHYSARVSVLDVYYKDMDSGVKLKFVGIRPGLYQALGDGRFSRKRLESLAAVPETRELLKSMLVVSADTQGLTISADVLEGLK